MSSWIISGLVVACTLTMTLALFPGTCPDFTPQAPFKPEKMAGRWYGVYANKHGLPLENVKCVTNDYSYSPADDSLTVILTQTNVTDNKATVIFVPSEPIDGVPNHAIIKGEMGKGPFQQIFTILFTNYDKTVLTIICASNGQYYGYGVQVYSRETTVAPKELKKVKKVLEGENIPQELFPIVQDCQNEIPVSPSDLPFSTEFTPSGLPFSTESGLPFSTDFSPSGLPFSTESGLPFSTDFSPSGLPFSTESGLPFSTESGLPFSTDFSPSDLPFSTESGLPFSTEVSPSGLPFSTESGIPLPNKASPSGIPFSTPVSTSGIPLSTRVSPSGIPLSTPGFPIRIPTSTTGRPFSSTARPNVNVIKELLSFFKKLFQGK